jgi:hypothetical protein
MPKIKPSLKTAFHLFMKFKNMILGTLATASIGWGGVWVGNVNATGDAVTEFKVILPRVEAKLDENSRKQDLANAEIGQVNQRLANIEGRLSK